MLVLIFNRYRDAGKVTIKVTGMQRGLQLERGL